MFRRHRWLPLVLVAFAALGLTLGLGFADGLGAFGEPLGASVQPAAITLIRGVTEARVHRFASARDFDGYVRRVREAARIQAEAEEAARRARGFAAIEVEELAIAGAEEAPASTEASITNNQEAGVDEGGIVKAHGDFLIVLRRGRLFSVRLGADGALEPVSRVDAYPPGTTGGWYDEMLVSGDTVVVIGYQYGSWGTEVGRFHIDDDGRLSRVDTHYLTSDDYYSSRNYASRLVGDTLIFYMPYALVRPPYDAEDDATVRWPGVREASDQDWDAILDWEGVYAPVQITGDPVLHTVVACDVSAPRLACRARGILGPSSRTFYVSRDAVYVWVGPDRWGHDANDTPVVYRLPLDEDAAVGALRVRGAPIDQLAFREADGFLTVLVQASGGGDAMWAAEADADALAVLRVPLAAFTDGVAEAPARAFTPVPGAGDGSFHVRHVGDHVLYGTSPWYEGDGEIARPVFVHATRDGTTERVPLPHSVARIEGLGERAVVIGPAPEGLQMSALDLDGAPRVSGTYLRPGAREGESRSHGFFYRATGPEGGTVGLPIRYYGGRWASLDEGSAGVLYVGVAAGEAVDFTPLGTLDASGETTDDHCVASCADWYGNARPVFYRGRVFALLGYELVEGRIVDGAIEELARTHLYEDLGRPASPVSSDAGVPLDAAAP
ncbi:MAG: beta-propeller domain-containing protein [Myxococcales bacterium]|nr:beta-propeller domain-containing protein [Myxococcales bacterium]